MDRSESAGDGTDVVVIGAGAAGLAAARELERRGVDYRVLEARRRVGGRAHTIERDGSAIELGAEFVHGEAKTTIAWLDRLAVPYLEVAGEHWRRRGARLLRVDRLWERVAVVMRQMDAQRRPDRSFAEFLATRPGGPRLAEHRRLARAFVQGFHAADPERVGERGLAAGGDPTADQRSMRIIGGYAALLERIAAPLLPRIRAGAEVTAVEWRPGEVRVHARQRGRRLPAIDARAAIVTVPLGVLQARPPAAGAIRFDPVPPGWRAALDGLVMGDVVHVALLLGERLWERARGAPRTARLDRLSFLHTPGRTFNVWWTQAPIRLPLVVGWAGGAAARKLLEAGPDAVVHRAIAELAHALALPRSTVERAVRDALHADWSADPWARGAYSYAAVGGAGAARRLARAVEHTLWIAGEATAGPTANGTVDGALREGRRAAVAVARHLAGLQRRTATTRR